MKTHFWGAAVLASTLGLTACGGGGGGTPAAQVSEAPAARSTALADNPAPAGFDFAGFRNLPGLRSTDLLTAGQRFDDPTRAYVSLWYTDEAGERRQLTLLRLSALQALDDRGGLSLSLPRNVAVLAYEVYDRAGAQSAVTGEIRQ